MNPGLEAKTLIEDLQRRYPGNFSDGQLRTLQRHVKRWSATEDPSKEVFFPQLHRLEELAQSDFTHMGKVGITINKQAFDHLIYHFVLTYSNWETGSSCYSESFESLSEGLQAALWELGGVPRSHQTGSQLRYTTPCIKTNSPNATKLCSDILVWRAVRLRLAVPTRVETWNNAITG